MQSKINISYTMKESCACFTVIFLINESNSALIVPVYITE